MENYSSVILLNEGYQVVGRRDFTGTEFLVMPIFAGYSQKYFQRNLFEESDYQYLDELNKVMTPDDLCVKRFFDEEVLPKDMVLSAIETLMISYSLPKETYLRLSGYVAFIKATPGSLIVQQNSNAYPDVDQRIIDGCYQK